MRTDEVIERIRTYRMAAGGALPDTLVEHLYENGFFYVPASIGHHGDYVGGMADHSIQVAVELSNITTKMQIQWKRPQSPIIIGLLHDYVKMFEYEVREDAAGDMQYTYSNRKAVPGHGEASVILLLQWMNENAGMILTTEEMMCIRYHMGAFVEKTEWEYYSRAVKEYPNILWTHTADMIASQVKNI